MNILITGSRGFLAKELIFYFAKNPEHNVISMNKYELPLLDKRKVADWFSWNHNKIDIVIHTAAIGGGRQVEDGVNVFFDNIEMFRNVYDNCIKYNLLLFNFTSGIEDYPEYLGYAKKAISSICDKTEKNIINLKIWNCFGKYGKNTRFIEGNINNYINNKDIIIHKNRFFDFFYSEDVYKIICYFINEYKRGDINTEKIECIYKKSFTLKEVAKMINNVDNKKVNIKILEEGFDRNYVGNKVWYNLDKLNVIGLKEGIKVIYEKQKITQSKPNWI